ncbi:hypothetical protein VI26_08455 [Chromobacterium sp. LK1]|uniref:hypothetical protein n=1 Tax=Chromobacterium sp. LK1 TaxID=1628193 RepID=UPI000653B7C9|nr:hypothetical protein [Chromobacterium sp. LK1]KMN36079.1 hypothetical protein VI26_08455 [Chromobacterium sp. LK1]
MVPHEDLIRSLSLKRVACLFNVAVESLSLDARFGTDLHAKPRSFFRDNEFDEIEGDIMDVADKKLRNEMGRGEYKICTVGDYCEHMVRCYSLRPKVVEKILGLMDV